MQEFLEDDAIALLGIRVLDQLVWARAVPWDNAEVQRLMSIAESHHDEGVRQQAAFIREYIADQQRLDELPENRN